MFALGAFELDLSKDSTDDAEYTDYLTEVLVVNYLINNDLLILAKE